MNKFKKIIEHKREMENIINDLEGAKIEYNGYQGTVISVHLNGTATIHLENSIGMTWEEDVTWETLAKC
ncbi:hypothetical protein ACOMCU_01575 [Lysinibacillus sp. UGB7]|uniref:hypothetical protein n=1 Tax=Lysinibacillus sp. UGB7 TaxID=3411039 RepID=UPI003B76E5A1